MFTPMEWLFIFWLTAFCFTCNTVINVIAEEMEDILNEI